MFDFYRQALLSCKSFYGAQFPGFLLSLPILRLEIYMLYDVCGRMKCQKYTQKRTVEHL